MTIGQAIHVERTCSNNPMTQQELAHKAGISRSYLAGVETDRYCPSIKTALKIAKALDITLSQLLQGVTPSEVTQHDITQKAP